MIIAFYLLTPLCLRRLNSEYAESDSSTAVPVNDVQEALRAYCRTDVSHVFMGSAVRKAFPHVQRLKRRAGYVYVGIRKKSKPCEDAEPRSGQVNSSHYYLGIYLHQQRLVLPKQK